MVILLHPLKYKLKIIRNKKNNKTKKLCKKFYKKLTKKIKIKINFKIQEKIQLCHLDLNQIKLTKILLLIFKKKNMNRILRIL